VTAGAITDRHTHTQRERDTPAILQSVPCYAVAMGQINILNLMTKSVFMKFHIDS